LSVVHTTTPFITTYKRSGDTFTKINNPGTLPHAAGTDVTFSSDDQYMVIAEESTPNGIVYKTTLTTETGMNKIYKSNNDIDTIFNNVLNMNAIGYAISSGVENDEKTITAI